MLHHLVINQSGFRGFTGVYLNLHLLPSTRCACFYEVRCYYYGIYLCVREIKRVCVRACDRGNMCTTFFLGKKMLANVVLSLVVEPPSAL